MYLPKDFIETAEGLIFAVVEHGLEQDKVLCFLRYVKHGPGWQKYSSASANKFLAENFPDYLYYSKTLDAHLHGVPVLKIIKHHQPRHQLQLIAQTGYEEAVCRDLLQLCWLLQDNGLDLKLFGVTGSILVKAQNPASDIDLVCYDRKLFAQCRELIRQLIKQGKLHALNGQDWQVAYERRCSELSFTEYVWHEQRKFNKAMINGRKFDLSYVSQLPRLRVKQYKKCNFITLRCKILDDRYAFDYPAEFGIDHEQISSIVCFTATYVGQAVSGEEVEVAGWVEETEEGVQRIVVGSSREAHDEYIKVIEPTIG